MMDDNELLAREKDADRFHHACALLSTNRPQGIAELETLAGQGSVMSMLCLGWTYYKKMGADIDLTTAEKWYKSAYQNGASTALISLGMIYFEQAEYPKAKKIFLDGVSQNDSVSMYWLGRIYLLEQGDESKD